MKEKMTDNHKRLKAAVESVMDKQMEDQGYTTSGKVLTDPDVRRKKSEEDWSQGMGHT